MKGATGMRGRGEPFVSQAVLDQLQRQNRELKAVSDIAQAVNRSLDLQGTLKVGVRETLKVVGGEAGCILLLEGQPPRWMVAAYEGVDRELFRRLEEAVQGDEPWPAVEGPWSDMLALQSLSGEIKKAMRGAGFRAFNALPLQSKGGALGIIILAGREERLLGLQSIEALMTIAEQLGTAIENARLYHEAQRELAERKRAEESLRKSEERYRSLFEGVPVGLYRTTPDGHFLDVNPAMLEMLNYPDQESLQAAGTTVDLQVNVTPEDRQWRQAMLKRDGALHDLEVQLRRRDGTIIWGRSNLRAARDADGQVLYYEGSVEDITERKRAEEALRKAHEELERRVQERTAELAKANEALRAEITERKRAEEALQDREATARALLNAPIEAATLVDADGIILAANETTAKRFKKSVDELVGLSVYDLWPPAVAKFRKVEIDRVFRLGAPVRFEDRHEGRVFDHSFYPVFDAQGKVVRIAVFVRDVTQRKEAEERILSYQERLRSLASQLSLTEERERRRMATELHDRVGQTLAICKIKLGALRQSASSTEFAEPLDEIHELIEEIIRDTRSLTFELSSPILYQLGLEAALEWLTEQIQERDDIPAQFSDDRQPKPLDDDVRVLLFQAVRELLVNVVKHAQARNVKVAIWREDSDVQISVEDDGVGFATFPIGSHWSEIKGFGLFSIRERLDYLGGQLKIVSEPGHGTKVTLVAPLKREEATSDQ